MKKWIWWISLCGLGWCQEPVALVQARLEGVEGPRTLVLRGESIEEIRVDPPAGVPQIDLQGLYVYPGLVQSDSLLGLIETESVRATVDVKEVGENNADLRVEVAFNPDSELLPVARSAGILTAVLQPQGSLICGQAAVLELWGWSAESMRRRSSPGVVVRWPEWGSGEKEKVRAQWYRQLGQLEDWFQEARAYSDLSERQRPIRPELAALSKLWKEQGKVFVHAQSRFQIESAAEFFRRHQLPWVLVGGAQADECQAILVADRVEVIYTETFRLPRGEDQDFDHYYRIPARLHRAGIQVALAGPGSYDNARWLTQMAATTLNAEWTPAQAIASMTRVPCEILGLQDQGSLAAGQRATLIACDRPLLDGRAQVRRAWVAGREIDLEDRQKRLYQRYRNKPRLIQSSTQSKLDP